MRENFWDSIGSYLVCILSYLIFSDGKHRCPLGKCLEHEKICDGIPDCEDASDERADLCYHKIQVCEQVNATHCQCLLDDMMCDNLKCLHR